MNLFDSVSEGHAAASACADTAAAHGWDADRAAESVLAYLRQHGPTHGETLTDHARIGNEPHNAKAFGAVFLRLKRAGKIRTCGSGRRSKGHGAPGLIWEAIQEDQP